MVRLLYRFSEEGNNDNYIGILSYDQTTFQLTEIVAPVEFTNNTTATQYKTDMVELANGNVAITWQEDLTDSSGYGVFASIIDPSDGSIVKADIQVNQLVTGNQQEPEIDVLSDGTFVIVWQDHNGDDGDLHGIFGQRFDQDGNQIGTWFQINKTASGKSEASTN